MTALAELIPTVVHALVELSLLVGELAARPFRFVASGAYRREVRQRWRGRPWRRGWEVFGGSAALLLLVGVADFWLRVFGPWSSPPLRPPHPTFRQRVAEKLQARRQAREHGRDAAASAASPKASNPALERTPTAGNASPVGDAHRPQ